MRAFCFFVALGCGCAAEGWKSSSADTTTTPIPEADALSARLGPRGSIVAYRSYSQRTIDERSPSIPGTEARRMCALVLRGDEKLDRFELGTEDAIGEAVEAWRKTILAVDPDPEAEEMAGARLRRLVLDPLLPVLAGTDRVLLALDGSLQEVPFDALPSAEGQGKLVGDSLPIEMRRSLGERLLERGSPLRTEVVLVGGVEYGGPALAPAVVRGSSPAAGFGPLAASDLEVREIAKLHQDAFASGETLHVLAGEHASRAALIDLVPRARFLHVATHAWFAPERFGLGMRMSSEERVKGMSPMLLCGLALADANLGPDLQGRVPGILTAEEVSAFDLSGCELAVLAAGETALGVRRAGQGAASFQKALQMAGARSVITSLWKVPDQATRELMVDFYRRIWVEKKPKARALWEAKRKLREAKDEQGRPLYSTRDWAAWVLSGDPD